MLASEQALENRTARAAGRARVLAGLLVCVLCAVFAWNVRQTWFLTDDAFISFRYARNLVDGLGPNWNAGERVEGYTNFAWMLLLAAGMRFGLAPEVLANTLGIACGVALLVSLARFAARGRSWRSPLPWLAVGVLVLNRSFAAWCTGGLETMFFTLLVFLGFARLLGDWRHPTRAALVCSACFALATLTRPEGALFSALAFGLLGFEVLRGRRSIRALASWLAPLVLIVGTHLLWRRAYYGDWVPNTFHAKVGGLWLAQGARYYAYFHATHRIGYFLPLLVLACFGERRAEARALSVVLLAYGLYVLAVGGDWFELRFFVHVFPLLYWLLCEGLGRLATLGEGRLALPARLGAGALALALAAATVRGFERVPTGDFGIKSVPNLRGYAGRRQQEGQYLRAYIERGVLPRDLVLGLGGAGAVPYYTGWTTVDRRGLNDRTIAHLPLDQRGRVAHEHDAPWEYLVQRRVAVFDWFNQLLVPRAALEGLEGPFRHAGRDLEVRAVFLGPNAMVFATFLDDAELAQALPGLAIRRVTP